MDLDLLPPASAPDAAYTIVSGSFRSLSLVLLAFYPLNKTIQHIETIPAFGPHQYLASTPARDHVYSTSWALPPILSSWKVQRTESRVVGLEHVNTVPITATSSYIDIPPPYTFVYSAGGPTGEVHERDTATGALGKKVQQFLFVPEDELEKADKTRVALRYGSHGIEFSSFGHGFVPVLGTDSIEMYARNPTSGELVHISTNPSPRGPDAHDGPRHVKVHPNGKVLYSVTEHTNLVDVYDILDGSLKHVDSRSILPPHLDDQRESASEDPHTQSKYRGDTLILTPSTPSNPAPTALLTTTRGSTPSENGWLSIFHLDDNGYFVSSTSGVIRFETPTSGGKANALDIRTKGNDDGIWILLTDDDKQADERGAVRVLQWDGWKDQDTRVRVVAEWPSGLEAHGDRVEGSNQGFTGASHAIWLD